MKQTFKDVKYNQTHEDSRQINFLDPFLIRKPSRTENNIFRKSINTDATISFFSNYPIEYKMAAFRYITRMHSIPLTPERK